MKKLLSIIIICSVTIFSASCGFTMRSKNSLPPQLKQLYYSTNNPYDQFDLTLKNALKTSGVLLQKNATNTLTLQINSRFFYNQTAPATSTQTRIYSLTYTADVMIISPTGTTILPQQATSISRNITLAPNEVFDVSSQVATAKQELQNELATKILNILSAPKTFTALTNS